MISRKKQLFENDDNNDTKINLNKDYAANYESWRRKEELNKCMAKYGEIEDNSSSSSDDEDLPTTELLDKDFLQTLSCLKNNDPRIYDESITFFKNKDTNQTNSNEQKSKKEKPMLLRDYERKVLLETEGKIEDEEQNEDQDFRPKSPTYVQEQEQIKDHLKKALQVDNESDDDGDKTWGGMFKKREKTKEELEKEENDYIQWLKGQKESLEDNEAEKELKPLKDYWYNPKLDKGEQFLRDYILNKGFLDDSDNNYIPSYDEIVHDSDENLSEDGETIQKQEEFETKYNYRFEEPDKEFLKRYPRTIENSVRKTDDRRKQKRVEIRERKKEEKLRKQEELKRLKAMKRKEIEEKINKLKEITGNQDLAFKDEDIEGDFDPEEHDKRMKELFNDEFYAVEEGEQKPEFPDIDEELEIENWDNWKGETVPEQADYEPHCEDDDFIMDCDYDPVAAEQLKDAKRTKKRKKRKTKFAEVLSEEKPIFDPNLKTYEEYLDEYYKLDYEDIIGDLPCRFKYRKVVPNDFGLTVEEILAAKDKELNKWCSLKKAVQIRPEHVEKYDIVAYKKKAQNSDLKRKIFQSIYENDNEDDEKQNDITSEKLPINKKETKTNSNEISDTTNQNKSKKQETESETNQNQIFADNKSSLEKKKKKKNKGKKTTNSQNDNKLNTQQKAKKRKHSEQNYKSQPKSKKMKLNKKKLADNSNIEISDERLKAYGIKPKQFKNKLKYGNKNK